MDETNYNAPIDELKREMMFSVSDEDDGEVNEEVLKNG